MAVDRPRRWIVAAVRGTLSLDDALTDCLAEPAGFPTDQSAAQAHRGIACAATVLVSTRCCWPLERVRCRCADHAA